MSAIKTTAEIKKFGYEIGDGYTVVISLDEKLKGLAMIYELSIHPPRQDEQLIQDDSYEKFSFKAFALRSLDFRAIKSKIDGEAMKKLVDLKALWIEKVGITLSVVE